MSSLLASAAALPLVKNGGLYGTCLWNICQCRYSRGTGFVKMSAWITLLAEFDLLQCSLKYKPVVFAGSGHKTEWDYSADFWNYYYYLHWLINLTSRIFLCTSPCATTRATKYAIVSPAGTSSLVLFLWIIVITIIVMHNCIL